MAGLVEIDPSELGHPPFADENRVGGGGFSVVYKGRYHGATVAIKRLIAAEGSLGAEQATAEFNREAITLSGLRHPNIVQIMGVCRQPPERLLVTEFVPYSLEQVLYQPQLASRLSPAKLLSLAQDIARGMSYLHSRKPQVRNRRRRRRRRRRSR